MKVFFRKIRSLFIILRNRKSPRLNSLEEISDYWENRYREGGNSGAGSYGDTAIFKAKVINQILEENDIRTILDFGCGDGAQLSLLKLENRRYFGIDVSPSAIDLCKSIYRNANFEFNLWDGSTLDISLPNEIDLSMSNDVLYHLTDDIAYKNYMKELFAKAKFVLIFSMDYENRKWDGHVRHRKFTTDINSWFPSYELTNVIRDTNSKSGTHFFLYGRKNI